MIENLFLEDQLEHETKGDWWRFNQSNEIQPSSFFDSFDDLSRSKKMHFKISGPNLMTYAE